MSGCRVFIGHLSPHARERDVEKFFKGYGRIREINLKNGFGFVVSVSGSPASPVEPLPCFIEKASLDFLSAGV